MASDPDSSKAIAGIKALPPTTVRKLGSSQVLVDPSSVVKELVENALDARATAIFVDIAANTIDSTQVKDNGHGIPAEDRSLICRRYCTSKIRDFDELRDVGGKWLGFRGEAMASMAEMSGALGIITRVEGEPVAVLLKFRRNGEIESTERASHPVGTTVKVTDLFKAFPVRKQDALKHSTKWLTKIRRLMQSYALARPTIRFQLRVLKAKTEKGNFNYAPKAKANVEDAAFKVVGRDCASQCEWTAMESDGFEVHAFLPKSDADGPKIAGLGAFLSVDSRPVTATRGTMKKVVAVVKERLRKANHSLASVKDPFLCMNIICPPDSYDPNIEPAKDDVLFENEELVISVVDKLVKSFYPEAVAMPKPEPDGTPMPDFEAPTSAQVPPSSLSYEIYEDISPEAEQQPISTPQRKGRRWRSNMYGIDEEDLALLSENQPPDIEEEEEGRRAAEVSNPWTIAKMNAAIKPRKLVNNPQLMTPAKGPGDVSMSSSSPLPAKLPNVPSNIQPLTPQTLSQLNASQSPLNDELTMSIQRLPQPRSKERGPTLPNNDATEEESDVIEARPQSSQPVSSLVRHDPFSTALRQRFRDRELEGVLPDDFAGPSQSQQAGTPLHMIPEAPRRGGNRKRGQKRKAFNDADDFFSSPSQRGPSTSIYPPRGPRPNRKPGRKAAQNAMPMFPSTEDAGRKGMRGEVLDAAERLHDNLSSENNTDIRDFFGQNRGPQTQQRSRSLEPTPGPSFTPIDLPARQIGKQGHRQFDNRDESLQPSEQDITESLRAYAELEAPPAKRINRGTPNDRPSSAPDSEHAFANTPNPAFHQRASSPTPGPSNPNPLRPIRRRTTEGIHPQVELTRSSHLPLERTPPSQYTHNLILSIKLLSPPVAHLRTQMRKLDMSVQRNSLEWGYVASEDSYDVFGARVMDGRIKEWGVRVVGMLDGWFERRGDVDAVVEVLGGLKGALEGRWGVDEDEEMLLV